MWYCQDAEVLSWVPALLLRRFWSLWNDSSFPTTLQRSTACPRWGVKWPGSLCRLYVWPRHHCQHLVYLPKWIRFWLAQVWWQQLAFTRLIVFRQCLEWMTNGSWFAKQPLTALAEGAIDAVVALKKLVDAAIVCWKMLLPVIDGKTSLSQKQAPLS